MARYDLPRAAEGPLRLVQLFVNSVDREHGREWWPTPSALAAWLAEHDLGGSQPTTADLAHARELREALRSLLRANTTAGDTRAAAATVNRFAARGEVTLAVDERSELVIAVRGGGVDAAFGQVLAIAFQAMLDGSWRRLKTCRHCEWVFYDASKNRSGSWCSMQLCGNRTKTRAYRRRKALEGQA